MMYYYLGMGCGPFIKGSIECISLYCYTNKRKQKLRRIYHIPYKTICVPCIVYTEASRSDKSITTF